MGGGTTLLLLLLFLALWAAVPPPPAANAALLVVVKPYRPSSSSSLALDDIPRSIRRVGVASAYRGGHGGGCYDRHHHHDGYQYHHHHGYETIRSTRLGRRSGWMTAKERSLGASPSLAGDEGTAGDATLAPGTTIDVVTANMRHRLFGSGGGGGDDDAKQSGDDDKDIADRVGPPPARWWGQHLLDNIDGSNRNITTATASSSSSSASNVLRWLVNIGSSYEGGKVGYGGVTGHDEGLTTTTWTSPITRVQGCVATVNLQTTVQSSPRVEHGDNIDAVVSIRGTADAMVSRGLLVLLSNLIESQTIQSVMALQPDRVTQLLGLDTVLSQGRNDGVASMIRTIQRHLREYLDQSKQQVDDGAPSIPSSNVPLYRTESISTDALNANAARAPSNTATTAAHVDPIATTSDRTRGRVALLLSGGVDSSVALHLLLQQQYQVTCYYLKIWLQDEVQHLGSCPWEDDYRICQQVCQQAQVELRTVSLQNEYHQSVVEHSIREAELGRTPNPDVLCNSRIKFGMFLKYLEDEAASAMEEDDAFDYVASGHYAQVERDPDSGTAILRRAPDPVKDQSYFLCALNQRQLQRLLFPIGHLQKLEVRELAQELQLPNRSRPDSQGLCFLGKVKFDDFLASYLGERPGPIVDAATGERLGTHRGVWYHTVGQRKGIGLYLHPKATSRGPWYVVAKDPRRDVVYCSNTYDESQFSDARSKVAVENVHWLAGVPPPSLARDESEPAPRPSASFLMKVRHGPKLVSGTLQLDESDPTIGNVQLDQVDSGLAPGQYLVFYNGTECLGAGIISERHWIEFVTNHPSLNEPITNDTARALADPVRS